MKITIGEEVRRYSMEYVELEMEMDDKTEQMLYEFGLKMFAENRADVINYAVTNALKKVIENEDGKESDEFRPCNLCSGNASLPLCPSCENNKTVIETLKNEAKSSRTS